MTRQMINIEGMALLGPSPNPKQNHTKDATSMGSLALLNGHIQDEQIQNKGRDHEGDNMESMEVGAAYMSWALMTGDTRPEGLYVVRFNKKDIGSLTKPIVVEWKVDCLEHIVPASPASHILVLFEVGTGVEDEVPLFMWLELPRDPAAARGLFPADVGADVRCYLAEVPQVACDFQSSRVMRSCITCGRIGASQNCGRCKIATYCSRACQLQDWDSHKTPCKFIASTL
jgi:hypothetical protein